MGYSVIRARRRTLPLLICSSISTNAVPLTRLTLQTVNVPKLSRKSVTVEHKKERLQLQYCYSLTPTYAVVYRKRADGLPFNRKVKLMPKHKSGDGVLSQRAAKRMRKSINWMLLLSKRKSVFSLKDNKTFTFVLAFITLTLSDKQHHTDGYVKDRMLAPFLKWLERNGCALYVWKAETQTNGNIHFHITINGFIHWKSIRKKWNSIQAKHGYHKVFTKGKNEVGVNSTDVHSVRNEKETAAYMAKYMTKNDETRRKVDGRLWGSSYVLSRIDIRLQEVESKSIMDEFDAITWTLQPKLIKSDYCEVLCHKHANFLKIPYRKFLLSLVPDAAKRAYEDQQLLFEVDSFSSPLGLS